jgi:ABC-type amino acid transport system permease subunit
VSAFYLAMSLPMAHLAHRLERRLQHRQIVEQTPAEAHA